MFSLQHLKPLILQGIALSVSVFVLSFPLSQCLRRCGVIDKPNARSNHKTPTVRGGGLILVIAMMIVLPYMASGHEYYWFLAGYIVIAAVSFVDDWRSLSASSRFVAHTAAAFVFVIPAMRNTNDASIVQVLIGAVLTAPLLIGYTNSFNFMDGINGLAASEAIVTGLGTAALGLSAGEPVNSLPTAIGYIVAFSAAGFLPYNFPKARMFMGDVGSAPLGFALAAAALWLGLHHGLHIAICLVLLHANFLFDTTITFFRRAIRGDRWYDSHREHFYQRLVMSGYNHTQVTYIESVLQTFCTIAVVLLFKLRIVFSCAVVFCVLSIWGAFFYFCESKFRQVQTSQL